MKQPQEVYVFKNELKNYRYYEKRIKSLETLIELCYGLLPGNVHAIDYSHVPGQSVSNKDFEYKIRDEIEIHERNKRRTQAKLDSIDEILAKIENDIKTAIILVYVEGNKMSYVARKYYLSTNALQYRMNKALERALYEK